MELGWVISIADPAGAAARDAVMVAAARDGHQTTPPPSPGIGPGVLLEGDPRAGQLFVQGRVGVGSATGLFDDVVGRGWTLVSPLADPVAERDPESAAFFARLGGIGTCVGAATRAEALRGTYARRFGKAGLGDVLR